MAIHVRDPETDRVVRKLAATTGDSITEAIRKACETELGKLGAQRPNAGFSERIRPVVERLRAIPDTGVKTDKAFYDALNDE